MKAIGHERYMFGLENTARATLQIQLASCGSSHAARSELPHGLSMSNRDEEVDECDGAQGSCFNVRTEIWL